MLVVSTPGTRCPKENNPRSYITDTEPVDIEPTSYYQRLIAEGSLVAAAKPEGGKK